MSEENGKVCCNCRHSDRKWTDGIRMKLGLYDLRTEGAKWVARHIGEDYVEEFLAKYDNINRGIPIGGYAETIVFLDLIERIKAEI